jgi:hypothetical protein
MERGLISIDSVPKKIRNGGFIEDIGLVPVRDNLFTLRIDGEYYSQKFESIEWEIEEYEQQMRECPNLEKESREEIVLLQKDKAKLERMQNTYVVFIANLRTIYTYKLEKVFSDAGFIFHEHRVCMRKEELPGFMISAEPNTGDGGERGTL